MLKRSLTVITAPTTIAILVFTVWGLFQPQKANNLSLVVTPRYENEESMIGLKVKPTKKTPTDPPATNPPATNPPATNPPATNPPATNPPATNPPATNPPVTASPISNPSIIVPKEDGDSDAFNTRESLKLTLAAETANIFTPTASETVALITSTQPTSVQTNSLTPVSTPGEISNSGIRNFILLVIACVGIVVLSLVTLQKLTGR
jgi:hypothetical protein